MNHQTFRTYVKSAMQEKGITTQDLAEHIGMTKSQVTVFLQKGTVIPTHKLTKIAELLSINMVIEERT